MSTASDSRGCADVVVLGAGVAGLTSALCLARAGVPVEVLEQDRSPAPAGRRGAGSWRRDSVPHANQAHVFSPDCYRLLADQLPDVLSQLLDVGARELAVPAPAAAPALAVRRPVFDWVLRRVAEREPLLRVHGGVTVTGVSVAAGRLSGVLVSGGVLRTSLAVDATGAARPAGGWLAALGYPVIPAEPRGEDLGRVEYFSRDYALHWPGDPTPLNLGPAAGGEFPGYTARVVPGDNNTFTVTFAVPIDAAAHRHLAGLASPAGFDTAAHAVPLLTRWVDPATAEPLGPVSVLRGHAPSGRRLVPAAQLPGLVAVGDALCTDDPCSGLGVASALASGLACARVVPHALAGGEPDLTAIGAAVAAAVDEQVPLPARALPRFDGPDVATLADVVRRATGASAVPV